MKIFRRFLSVTLSVIMCVGLMSGVTSFASTEEEALVERVLFDDDFDDYAENTEFLNTTVGNWKSLRNTSGYPEDWYVGAYGRSDGLGSSGSSAKVMADGNDKYLKTFFNGTGGGNVFPVITRNVSEGTAGMELPSEGILEVSAKVKVPSGITSANYGSSALAIGVAAGDTYTVSGTTVTTGKHKGFYHALKLDESGNMVPYNFNDSTFSLANNKWHTIKFIYDLSTVTAGNGTGCTIKVLTEGATEETTYTVAAFNGYGPTTTPLTKLFGIGMLFGGNTAYTTLTNTDGIMYDDFKVQISEHIKADAAGAFVPGTGYVADISVTAVANSAKDVWCVVAAYGENNKLIDAKIADFGSVAANTPESIEDITLANATEGETKRVCVLVWDGSDTMVPYSQPVIIYTAAE